MNIELLNKTIEEITTETLVEWYNVTQYSLETIPRTKQTEKRR